MPVDDFDDLPDEERERLHAALDAAAAEPDESDIEPEDLLSRLRAAR